MRQILTLDDARTYGLAILAVCRNTACRHRTAVDLDAVIYRVGAGRGLLPVKGEVHFSDMMKCSLCGGRGALLWPSELKGPEALFETQKGMSVHTWRYSDTLHSVVARVGHIAVAHAAFDAAVAAYPGYVVTLQEGIRVLRDARFKVVQGGKA